MLNALPATIGFAQAHPKLTALILGLVAATGFPPLGWWPLALPALAGLVALLCRAQNAKQAAMIGYAFGWSHLSLANNWIATAFTYQAEMPAFLGWLAVPLLCLYLAIYPALAALITHLGVQFASRRLGGDVSLAAFTLLLGASWIATEWLRGWLFTGYPWPPLGLVLLGDFTRAGIAGVLPWTGTYALSGLAILLAGLLASALAHRRWALAAALTFFVTAAMLAPSLQPAERGHVRFALIQPFIPQDELNNPAKYEEHFLRLARLTAPGNGDRRLVLWPESAVPDYLEDGYPKRYYVQMTAAADPEFARDRIGGLVGENARLLAGLVHLNIGEVDGRAKAVSARNSVSLLDGEGTILSSYDKAHLVPYGEYLPMRELLEPLGLSRLVAGTLDYIEGPGPQTLAIEGFGKAGIQVCYEIVFSGHVVERGNRPDYIFNPSNDGWFGAWGPPQHLAQARLRAIEEGLPVLRSTTTGISAVIDARGVVRGHIARGKADRIDGFIPPAHNPTLFARLGNWLPLGWALLLAALSLVVIRRQRV